MPAGEFELISRIFTALGAARADVRLGVGDDAAIIDPPAQHDSRCACLCLPLQDLAATALASRLQAALLSLVDALREDGFTPAWATLALTLSEPDESIVGTIAETVDAVCAAQDIAVIGGDTTAGEASLSVFLTGLRHA